MSNAQNSLLTEFFGRKAYILIAAFLSIPVYIATHNYVSAIGVHEDEATAFAITTFFILGVFAGRYLAQIRRIPGKQVSNRRLAAVAMVIIVCLSWVFFHAEFPLKGRSAINLLLYWLPLVVMSIATGMFIKWVRSLTQEQLNEARTSAAQSASELHLLQSQLSPHFLFNTLNNLYGLSISQHEKIPSLLLKLSELLRYSVYEANKMFVPLQDELAYVNNYIEFEKLRIGDRLRLTTQIENSPAKDVKIAPMLLIVFIENAFKHSKNTTDQQIFIDISLKTWENYILFKVCNSHTKNRQHDNKLDNNSGYGMSNVVKRLQLLYPNDHILEIENKDDEYKVMLQLKMKS